MSQWYVYPLNPIDFGWGNLQTVEEVEALIAKTEYARFVPEEEAEADPVKQFQTDYQVASGLAMDHGWEGDTTEYPSVFWLPMETDFAYGFVWKQESNGSTYVVSPVELPWLDQHRHG